MHTKCLNPPLESNNFADNQLAGVKPSACKQKTV